MTSAKVEEYLEAIHKLEQIDRPVRAHRLAECLKVSPPSVAEMLKKLCREGFVERTADMGILLTEKGEKAAIGLVRQHRLWERFLTDVLGISWDKVHDDACRLEHVASPEVQEGLEKLLANPDTCPHGHPIPSKDGVYAQQNTVPLTNLGAGQRALIVRISEEEPEMLHYLATLGLIPKIRIKIEEVAPFRGPLLVKVGKAKYALGREVASKIQVSEIVN
ncbi:MAG: metal-dependent transcriptional regulator [Chloroflexi bacterium]|nr:metal-dependent transcriptional regulator [Chloroflexota bacterium]MDA8188151.1 metal-dependent transcriptional regulator [Dehalococcoidales bacterium]